MTTTKSVSRIAVTILVLFGFFLLVTAQSASAQTEIIVPCENAPFDSSAERKRVKAESPDCYELRNNYSIGGVADALPLQNIDSTSDALLQRIQLFQQIVSLLQEVLRLVEQKNNL